MAIKVSNNRLINCSSVTKFAKRIEKTTSKDRPEGLGTDKVRTLSQHKPSEDELFTLYLRGPI